MYLGWKGSTAEKSWPGRRDFPLGPLVWNAFLEGALNVTAPQPFAGLSSYSPFSESLGLGPKASLTLSL